jgi:hypothetical protein
MQEGAEVDIICQTRGELVTPEHGTASNVWDKLINGHYVTDVYIDTPGIGGAFSPPIPRCPPTASIISQRAAAPIPEEQLLTPAFSAQKRWAEMACNHARTQPALLAGLSDERWIWLGLTEGDDHGGASRSGRSGRDDRAYERGFD